jgi:hypothetical protein
MKIAHDGEHVAITIGNELCVLSTREAFDAVTELLRAIEGARAYAAYLRGEIRDPDPRSNPMPRRQYRRRPNAKPD